MGTVNLMSAQEADSAAKANMKYADEKRLDGVREAIAAAVRNAVARGEFEAAVDCPRDLSSVVGTWLREAGYDAVYVAGDFSIRWRMPQVAEAQAGERDVAELEDLLVRADERRFHLCTDAVYADVKRAQAALRDRVDTVRATKELVGA
jgi:hypothetical protein